MLTEGAWKFFGAVLRVGGSMIPGAAPVLQIGAELDRAETEARFARIEDPIGALHPQVKDVARELYELLRSHGFLSTLKPSPDFFERYGKALARLEGARYIEGQHTLTNRWHAGLVCYPEFIVYAAALHEDQDKLDALLHAVDSAPTGKWIRGEQLAASIGVPITLVDALLEIRARQGLGMKSKTIGEVKYRPLA